MHMLIAIVVSVLLGAAGGIFIGYKWGAKAVAAVKTAEQDLKKPFVPKT